VQDLNQRGYDQLLLLDEESEVVPQTLLLRMTLEAMSLKRLML